MLQRIIGIPDKFNDNFGVAFWFDDAFWVVFLVALGVRRGNVHKGLE
jgi:hypothetical protein